ncbi:Ger(x)C family spore germination protein [Neobacillus sp. FSL H8-0543]|uniref:Ger(x)C family spore germination protein n=1 Tax=Neobacillus sp. FSL H8-0543 TaxID=2954672 RepID=UPI003158542A
MLNHPKWKRLIVIFSCVFCMTGCVQSKQLEKLGLITAVGYDLEQANTIKGSVVIHKFDPLAESVTKVITAESNTSKAIMQKQNLETDQKLVSGQLRCAIYSKDLAKKGINQLVDSLNRDPAIGNMVYLTVADDKASEIMQIDMDKLKVNLGTYLYNVIQQNVESEQLISPTLHEFNHKFSDRGQDPVLPILKIKKDNVIITGVALFQDDRYIDELESEKLFYLKILLDNYRSGTHEMGFKREKFNKIIKHKEGMDDKKVYNKMFINIDNIRSHAKIKLVDKEKLHFKVDVNLESRLLEATEAIDLSTPDNMKFIQKEIGKELEREIKNLILRFQKKQVDPIGFGNEYFTQFRGKPPTAKEWREKYKDATFEIKVNNKIVKTGAIE